MLPTHTHAIACAHRRHIAAQVRAQSLTEAEGGAHTALRVRESLQVLSCEDLVALKVRHRSRLRRRGASVQKPSLQFKASLAADAAPATVKGLLQLDVKKRRRCVTMKATIRTLLSKGLHAHAVLTRQTHICAQRTSAARFACTGCRTSADGYHK